MRIDQLSLVPRKGCILISEGNPAFPDEILEAAVRVRRRSMLLFKADSPEDALAWLLAISHSRCSPIPRFPFGLLPGFPSGSLLGFRGQRARYTSLVPTYCRLNNEQRKIHDAVLLWFKYTVQVFYDKKFRYILNTPYQPKFTFEVNDVPPIAQHYGIGTYLIDWTWDPLVAMVFALKGLKEGEQGSVLLGAFNPDARPNIIFPPTMAVRLWIQRGFLEETMPCPEQFALLSPGMPQELQEFLREKMELRKVANNGRILFPASKDALEFAEKRYQALLLESDPLLQLAEWALDAAKELGDPKPQIKFPVDANRDDLLRELKGSAVPLPLALSEETDSSILVEDLPVILDYFDVMALRFRDGTYSYDPKALEYFRQRLGVDSSLRVFSEPHLSSEDLQSADPRARWMGKHLGW